MLGEDHVKWLYMEDNIKIATFRYLKGGCVCLIDD